MREIITEAIGFVLCATLIYFLTRVIHFPNADTRAPKPKQSALIALGLLALYGLIVAILFLLVLPDHKTQPAEASLPANDQFHCGPGEVQTTATLAAIIVVPVVIVMQRCKESLASAGIMKNNLLRSVLVGASTFIIGVAAPSLIFHEVGTGSVFHLRVDHFWALLKFDIVGISEEFVFRGYLQTRLIQWLGRLPGWIIASMIQAFSHVPHRIAMAGLSPTDAIISSANLIVISLLMGYMMIRTGNIAASGVWHTLSDWLSKIQ